MTEQPAITRSGPIVDVIVPVYRGLDDTRCCIESVLSSRCSTEFELVVINDASPEPEVSQWLREAADRHGFTLLENPDNLGFVATVNRGMECHPDRDVVLLNSDAEVANDWLDRLVAAAEREPQTASVTPFSNNATICSYPRFPEGGEMLPGWTVSALDALIARVNAGKQVTIPTAVGFCMYIRRAALDAVGLFDVERFGKGYGEENEFCMRAAKAGWQHVLAADCFVRHAGGVSFGESASERQQLAGRVLSKMYPDYDGLVARFVHDDPIRPLRLAIDLARLAASTTPVVVHVTHALGGGTARHVRDLGTAVDATVTSLVLEPATDGEGRLRLYRTEPEESLDIRFDAGREQELLLDLFRAIAVDRLHFHHVLGLPEWIRELPERLGLPYDVTLHDFYFYCPQKHLQDRNHQYCGEPDTAGCNACLAHRPAPGDVDIETWRQRSAGFLERAERVFAPSMAVLERMRRHFPPAPLVLAPHPEPDVAPAERVKVRPLTPDVPLHVVVLGALGEIKGADVLERVAIEAARRNARVQFTLVGFAYRPLRVSPKSNLVVTGPYDAKSLPGWLERVNPHLVWFPAQVPETYSFTLSACLQAGLPVAVTDLGALPERIQGREWSWILPWNTSTDEWLDFFDEVAQKHFSTGQAPEILAGSPAEADFSYHDDYIPAGQRAGRASSSGSLSSTESHLLVERLMRASRLRGGTVKRIRRGAFRTALKIHQRPLPRRIFKALPDHWQTHLKRWLMRA